MRLALTVFALIGLTACGDFPTAGEPSGRSGYPELQPLAPILDTLPAAPGVDAARGADQPDPNDPDAILRARAADLNARADALRTPPG